MPNWGVHCDHHSTRYISGQIASIRFAKMRNELRSVILKPAYRSRMPAQADSAPRSPSRKFAADGQ